MLRLKREFAVVILAIVTMVVSMFATVVLPVSSQSSTADAFVLGTKKKYLWGQNDYVFVHDTIIAFDAPEIAGWTFDHIEVDFGSCSASGVTGANISETLTINGGRIQEWREG